MMKKSLLLAIFVLGVIIALPLALRRRAEKLPPARRQLVILTPHNESIRHEIELAFREYHRQRTGEEVSIDWRAIGGTTECVRYLRSTFIANFQHDWSQRNPSFPWDDQIASDVFNARTSLDGESGASEARRDFLAGNVGIDIDIFMGGGQYDHSSLAASGILVPAGVQDRHPEWFSGPEPILASGGGGETWYDAQDRYYAACFSSFGVILNFDRLRQAGLNDEEIAHFGEQWRDLADPRLYQAIGIADPSQSGSINKCFEMLIQREMQDEIAKTHPGEARPQPTPEELERAWTRAFTLIKQLGGNAAYLTFSAGKVPADAATGQIAAGMCIDFYGRSQVDWERRHVGRETVAYRTPHAASTVSADPIGLLRGAPDRELAEEFIDFVLSPEAQRLWARPAGTEGGPVRYTLYRQPVRRDLYTPRERQLNTCIGDAQPFELAQVFEYRGDWTGRLFTVMRVLIKVMIIDCGPELRAAWKDILEQGGLEAISPEQLAAFEALPFSYAEASKVLADISTPESQAILQREWIEFFRKSYSRARGK
ncbi:MAG: ABC transporter substrate-binding protein [Victivallales bacterium]|nr:ABC transporter substrate-binding protein [Victivallales bacterium]